MSTIQIPSALLEACVLAVLAKEEAYGYSLTQSIKETLDVSESTLYPVLRRLENDGLLSTYDQPKSGRIRRYYKLTQAGKENYQASLKEWQMFKQSIDKLRRTK